MPRRPTAPLLRRQRPAHRVPVVPWYARPGLLVGLLAALVTALLVALVAWLMVPRTEPAADRPQTRGPAPTTSTTSASGAGHAQHAPPNEAAGSRSTRRPEPTLAPGTAPTRAPARASSRGTSSPSPAAPLPTTSPTTALPSLTVHQPGTGRPTDKPARGNAGGRTP